MSLVEFIFTRFVSKRGLHPPKPRHPDSSEWPWWRDSAVGLIWFPTCSRNLKCVPCWGNGEWWFRKSIDSVVDYINCCLEMMLNRRKSDVSWHKAILFERGFFDKKGFHWLTLYGRFDHRYWANIDSKTFPKQLLYQCILMVLTTTFLMVLWRIVSSKQRFKKRFLTV